MNLTEYYNTQQNQLLMPEYGRNIQDLISYVKTVESKDKRNIMAKAIVTIMANLTPSQKDNSDFRIKIWNHFAQLSNYELDIDYPCEIIKKEDLAKKPSKLPYPTNNIKLKHYGAAARDLILKLKEMEDSESKEAFLEMLANHMKKLYLVWNKEAVSDEQIYSDINEIAGTELVKNKVKLNETRDILLKNQKPKQNNKQYRKNNHNKR